MSYSPKDLDAKIDAESKRAQDLSAKLDAAAKTRVTGAVADRSGSAPRVRKGESVLSSRGFMFSRLIGAMTGRLDWDEEAKVERNLCTSMAKNMASAGYKLLQGTTVAPFASSFFGEGTLDDAFRGEMHELVKGGVQNTDQDEMLWYAKKAGPAYMAKAQSWLDESIGGVLVGPAERGELIELFRNKDALINAGASVVPFGPTGRIQYPRQTGASSGYWLGENTTGTESTVTTGFLTLSAKKVVALVRLPNELLRFATTAAEALVRLDMSKTLSLVMDQGLLEGSGGDTRPMGLINAGITAVTPTAVASSNTLAIMSPQDIYLFTSAIEANNAEMTGFVMRPEMFYRFLQARAGVYNGSTTAKQGPFAFGQYRDLADGFGKQIGGFPVVTTPQVSQSRVQGTTTTGTYVLGGNFPDMVIAMAGGIEFLTESGGLQLASADQTLVRAILSCDGGPKHPGAFAWVDALDMTQVGA